VRRARLFYAVAAWIYNRAKGRHFVWLISAAEWYFTEQMLRQAGVKK
jgi:hypothetical protein